MIASFAVAACIVALAVTLHCIGTRRDRHVMRELHRRSPRYRPDRDDIATWHGVGPLAGPAPKVVVHHWPVRGDGRLTCCGGDPFADDAVLAINQAQVTCGGDEKENQ